MLQFLKRWLPSSEKGGKTPPALDELRAWAERRDLTVRQVRDGGGVVVDGRVGSTAWRMEFGPAQRAYVVGHEVRWRAELDFGSDWQLLVLNRALQEAMERAVYQQYVEGVQTQIDDQTPPEMRWLVMFPKLNGAELGVLRETYAACGNGKSQLQHWLEGPLTKSLAALSLPEQHPVVLMIGRGRLVLRTQLNDTDEAQIEALRRLFETALREARRVAEQDASLPQPAPSTQPSLWSASTLPREEPRD